MAIRKLLGALVTAALGVGMLAAPSGADVAPRQVGTLDCGDTPGYREVQFTSPLAGVLVFQGDPFRTVTGVIGTDAEVVGFPPAGFVRTAAGETHTVGIDAPGSFACFVGWEANQTPTNDQPAAAEQLSGSAGSVPGTTMAATLTSPAEPQPAPGAVSVVWYRWTAPVTGTVSFDADPVPTNRLDYMETSSLDTSVGVAVYGPTDHVTPLQVDGTGVATSDTTQEGGHVTVPVTTGAEYLISVFSAGGTGFLASPHGYTATGAFTLKYHVNRPPTPHADVLGTAVDVTGTVDVLTNDTDPDGDALSVSGFDSFSARGGSVARVRGNADRLAYVPPAGFSGVDGFDYTVVDDEGAAAAAHVTVYVGIPVPTIVPGSVTISEGHSGVTTVDLPVTLSTASSLPVTVQWGTVHVDAGNEQEAKPGDDYYTGSGTVTFAPGETSASVPITVKGDVLDEYDELFLVSFQAATNAKIGGFYGLGVAKITDDDALPTIVPDYAATSVPEGVTDSVVPLNVSLSAPAGRTVRAHYTMPFPGGNGVAEPGADYDVASGDVTFAPGATHAEVLVNVHGDSVPEEDELVGVAFSNPTNALIGGVYGIGAVRLVNDD